MKMIKGIIRPEKVEAVVDALAEAGFVVIGNLCGRVWQMCLKLKNKK